MRELKLSEVEKIFLKENIQTIIRNCNKIKKSIDEKEVWDETDDTTIPSYMGSIDIINRKIKSIIPILDDVKIWLYSHKEENRLF